MKTLNLKQEKEKLSGQLFYDVKAGLVEHPLENHVSVNFLYEMKTGKLKPTFVFISPKKVSVDAGWSILDCNEKSPLHLKEGDVINTPYGKFELYDSPDTLFKIDVRPYEYIADIYIK